LLDQALEEEQQEWVTWPRHLEEASKYVLSSGGKRVRPILALMVAEACGADPRVALPWALAVELVHNYSLVHDDLPAMDDDDFRRGQPTCHRAYDEATAILVGDALLTRAFEILAKAGDVQLVGLLGLASGGGGMVGGQVLDLSDQMTTLDAVESMQRLKTGALIRAAALGGALAASADGSLAEAASRYGEALGFLFQITDDVLDREQDAKSGGNNVLHHSSLEEVLSLRDRVALVAAEAATAFSPRDDHLRALVITVSERTV
jgi:geranylgeranyl diphosphate synthase type II